MDSFDDWKAALAHAERLTVGGAISQRELNDIRTQARQSGAIPIGSAVFNNWNEALSHARDLHQQGRISPAELAGITQSARGAPPQASPGSLDRVRGFLSSFQDPAASVSPQDAILMRSAGFSPNAVATGGNISAGPVSGSYKQFSEGPRVSEMGNASVTAPVGGGNVGFNVATQREVGQDYSVTPGINASLGPVSANYNRTYGSPQMRGQSFGGSVAVPIGSNTARLGYQRTQMGDQPATNTFGASLGDLYLAAVLSGALGPRFQAQANLPSFMGGELSAGGSYAPGNRSGSVFAKYRREF